MAITWTDDNVSLNTCQAKGDWSGTTFSNPDDNNTGSATPIFREGTGCMQASAASDTAGYWTDSGQLTGTDFGTRALVAWIWFSGPTELGYFGYFRVRAEDGTNHVTYDFLPEMQTLDVGGWFPGVCWLTPSGETHITNTGTPVLNSMDDFVLEADNDNTNYDVKLIGWDYIHAIGYIGAAGDTVDLEDFTSRDAAQNFGVFSQKGTTFQMQGKLRYGGTGTTTVSESGKTLTFRGANEDHPIGFIFNSGGTATNIAWTDMVFNCATFVDGKTSAQDLYTFTATPTDFKITGCTFVNFRVIALPADTANRWHRACKFLSCDVIDVGDGELTDSTVENCGPTVIDGGATTTSNTFKNSGQVDPTNSDYGGSQALDGTGDYIETEYSFPYVFRTGLTFIARAALDDWTPAANEGLVYYGGGSSLYAWFGVTSTTLRCQTHDGTTSQTFDDSTILNNATDGEWIWLKVELTFDTGTVSSATFYYSNDPVETAPQDVNWTAGATDTSTQITSIPIDDTAAVGGSTTGGGLATGDISYGSLWDGIGVSDGQQIFEADWRTGPDFTGTPGARPDGIQYQGRTTFDGTAGNYAEAPDIDAYTIDDFDIKIRAKVDWQGTAWQGFIGHGTLNVNLWDFFLSSTKYLRFRHTVGTTTNQETSSVTIPFPNGTLGWIRVTRNATTGDVKFYYSYDYTNEPDDVSWTQLGTTQSGSTGSTSAGAGALRIGERDADEVVGDLYKVWVADGSTVAFDANFAGLTSGEITGGSFTEDSPNAATVTFTGAAWSALEYDDLLWEESGNPVYTLGDNNTTAADLDGSTFDDTASYAALRWNVNTDPDGELDNVTFDKGTGTSHAIEFGKNTPATITLRGQTFTGFNAANGNADSTFYNNSGKALTINLVNCTGNATYRNGVGASTIVQQSVDVELTNVQPGSECLIKTDPGGATVLSEFAMPTTIGYVDLPGTNEYVKSLEKFSVYDADGDFEIITLVRAADYTPPTNQYLFYHGLTDVAATGISCALYLNGTGIVLVVSDGTAATTYSSSAIGATDATWLWLRVVYDYSGGQASFYKSTDSEKTDVDEISWTAMGTDTDTARLISDVARTALVGAWDADTPSLFLDGDVALAAMWYSGTRTTGKTAFHADWRHGPDFDANDRRPDQRFPDDITWELAGTTPTYTQASPTGVVTVSDSYAYTSDQAVTIDVRQGSLHPKYLPWAGGGTITSTGLSVQVAQVEDTIAS